ncbi:glycine betaine ABC transporter substrate-binding protein [Mycetocola zhadangensis]|uniref:Glycine betaine ABC transporter substrate-binding protein n=1 Tax=Mycetocola zhadangensis TaxID=1164595 RepID=A0A3L7J752_9MICO|nr:glycine betaine ABC transporter substrate-binding protein [Mycetocola zhadangensis]RLQ84332.1 glycine betaine ABC transporter substrate-binding protein [Mycetocola zhadangensis]GGE93950.1 ABC transporter substrate-binding protein [Mycetocola zhadangensis]
MNTATRIATAAAVAAGLVALTGCTAGSESAALENGDEKEITIAVFNGWDEAVASSVLWQSILEDEGYDVTLEYADPAPVFTGLAASDYDLTLDVWLPFTHKSYFEQYGDDIVDLGAWNAEGKNAIAVNADAPIDSIAELADNAELFGNRIVGIEPGAGLTMATEERVIPTYGLEDMEYITSSTSAMLTELTSATKAGENIAVTLWEPHWAYSEFPLKNLEDPEGALGETESIHTFAASGFTESHPTVAGWFENFEMDLDTLYSLENALFVDYDGDDYAPIVEKWIEDNQEYVNSLTS